MGNINISIPDTLHKDLKIVAAQSDVTIKELVQEALAAQVRQ